MCNCEWMQNLHRGGNLHLTPDAQCDRFWRDRTCNIIHQSRDCHFRIEFMRLLFLRWFWWLGGWNVTYNNKQPLLKSWCIHSIEPELLKCGNAAYGIEHQSLKDREAHWQWTDCGLQHWSRLCKVVLQYITLTEVVRAVTLTTVLGYDFVLIHTEWKCDCWWFCVKVLLSFEGGSNIQGTQ